MKKLIYYPNIVQTYPFSIDLFIQADKEAKIKDEATAKARKEKKSKFKLALGW